MAGSSRLPWAIVIVGGVVWWLSDREPHAPREAVKPVEQVVERDRAPKPAETHLSVVKAPAAGQEGAPAPPPQTVTRLYTTTGARVRSGPGTDFAIVTTLPAGNPVLVSEVSGTWRRIVSGSAVGWIRFDLLTDLPPAIVQPAPLVQQTSPPPRTVAPQPRRDGTPIREPYVGRCDCPYDLMRNGRLCGGRSAYSRPGGREPACYF